MVNQHTKLFRIHWFENIKTSVTWNTVTRGPNIRMSWNFDRYLLKVDTHEISYRTFVDNAIYVSVPGLIGPRVNIKVNLSTFHYSLSQKYSFLLYFCLLRCEFRSAARVWRSGTSRSCFANQILAAGVGLTTVTPKHLRSANFGSDIGGQNQPNHRHNSGLNVSRLSDELWYIISNDRHNTIDPIVDEGWSDHQLNINRIKSTYCTQPPTQFWLKRGWTVVWTLVHYLKRL